MNSERPFPSDWCEVLGCDGPAVGVYLDARKGQRCEFAVCAGHFKRLKKGEAPVVVSERLDVDASYVRPTVIMEP